MVANLTQTSTHQMNRIDELAFDREQRILKAIKAQLESNEKLIPAPPIKSARLHVADGYLPYGSRRLGLSPGTYIEIKQYILETTVSRLGSVFERIPQSHLALIYSESPLGVPKLLPENVKLIDASTILKDDEGNEQKFDFLTVNENQLRKLKEVVASEELTIFIGAGLSSSCGLPNWNELLSRLQRRILTANKCGEIENLLDQECSSPIIKARYLRVMQERASVNPRSPGSPNDDFMRLMHDCLYAPTNHRKESSPFLEALVALIAKHRENLRGVITHNFDDLLERALKSFPISCQAATNATYLLPGILPVFHVHGYLPEKDSTVISSIVFGEDDYHDKYCHAYDWTNIEQLRALMRTRCIFLGMSMTDPDLRRLLEFAYKESERDGRHFAFLKILDAKTTISVLNQHLLNQSKIYRELGVNVIWCNSYEDVPRYIRSIT